MLRSTASSSAVMPPIDLQLVLHAVFDELPKEAKAVRTGKAEEDAVRIGLEICANRRRSRARSAAETAFWMILPPFSSNTRWKPAHISWP